MRGQGVMAVLARTRILCPGAAVGVEDKGCSAAGVHAAPSFRDLYSVAPRLAARDQSLGGAFGETLSSLVRGDGAKVMLL